MSETENIEQEIKQLKKLNQIIEDNFGYKYSVIDSSIKGVKYLPSIKIIKENVERFIILKEMKLKEK